MIGLSALAFLAATTLAPPPSPPVLPEPATPPPEQVMAIPPALKQMLHERITPVRSPEQRLYRLVEMVLLPGGLELEYDAEATQTVAETFATRRANCLSFTLLFVALAREVGLEARVQEVRQVVTWYQDKGLIYNAGHVNVGLDVAGRKGTVDLDRNVLYDRRGPRPISDIRALAHFYNNRGAELMAMEKVEAAKAHYAMALSLEPRFTSTWNNLGVLHARLGDEEDAVRYYQNALSLDPKNPAALANATALHKRRGEHARAAQLAARMEKVRQRDPFYHFMLGNQFEDRGDYSAAIRHYRRAVQLYPSAHQFHFGLARSYFLVGNDRNAERELQLAQRMAQTSETKGRYQDKLDSLRRLGRRTAQH